MKVEVVLTEADITQEFIEAMEARDIPEKFFFWFPRSAAACQSSLGSDPPHVAPLRNSLRKSAPTTHGWSR